jgi:hypothetical protein
MLQCPLPQTVDVWVETGHKASNVGVKLTEALSGLRAMNLLWA